MNFICASVLALLVLSFTAVDISGQEPPTSAKPTEHVLGTVTNVDPSGQSVTVKEDGTGTEHLIQLQSTRTLLKVSPGAKDLKEAVRITPADLASGDRVDVRGLKSDSGGQEISARSLVLMSSRELQQAKQQEASAWQRSSGGTVTAVDPSTKQLTVSVRGPDGVKPVAVDGAAASFTRYSPAHPKSADRSQLSEIQVGDQVRIIGSRNTDGSIITAQKIYSGSFKTIAGTVVSVGPDGSSLIVKDLATKQPVTVALNSEAGVHKLPPMMAMMLARRFNPDMKGTTPGAAGPGAEPSSSGSGGGLSSRAGGAGPDGSRSGRVGPDGGPRPDGAPPSEAGGNRPGADTPGAAGPARFRSGGRMGNGDLTQMLDRLPKILLSDLKAGDAVIVSGAPSATEKTSLVANSVIAGVEPIFQAAPGKQAQSLGDWGSSLGGGAGMDASAPPQ